MANAKLLETKGYEVFRVDTYWRLIAQVRGPVGRRPTPKKVRELIFRMVVENPTWGAPRIHGELLMLGFDRRLQPKIAKIFPFCYSVEAYKYLESNALVGKVVISGP